MEAADILNYQFKPMASVSTPEEIINRTEAFQRIDQNNLVQAELLRQRARAPQLEAEADEARKIASTVAKLKAQVEMQRLNQEGQGLSRQEQAFQSGVPADWAIIAGTYAKMGQPFPFKAGTQEVDEDAARKQVAEWNKNLVTAATATPGISQQRYISVDKGQVVVHDFSTQQDPKTGEMRPVLDADGKIVGRKVVGAIPVGNGVYVAQASDPALAARFLASLGITSPSGGESSSLGGKVFPPGTSAPVGATSLKGEAVYDPMGLVEGSLAGANVQAAREPGSTDAQFGAESMARVENALAHLAQGTYKGLEGKPLVLKSVPAAIRGFATGKASAGDVVEALSQQLTSSQSSSSDTPSFGEVLQKGVMGAVMGATGLTSPQMRAYNTLQDIWVNALRKADSGGKERGGRFMQESLDRMKVRLFPQARDTEETVRLKERERKAELERLFTDSGPVGQNKLLDFFAELQDQEKKHQALFSAWAAQDRQKQVLDAKKQAEQLKRSLMPKAKTN
jgi:hypothetical protein